MAGFDAADEGVANDFDLVVPQTFPKLCQVLPELLPIYAGRGTVVVYHFVGSLLVVGDLATVAMQVVMQVPMVVLCRC